MKFPGPYILVHVIRTGGSEVSLCWTLLGYGCFGSEATYLIPARRVHKLFPARINSPHLAAGNAEYAGLAKYLKDAWGYNR
jgi:hypothetical protein